MPNPDQDSQIVSERTLAAIMFTDVVGYTSLMRRDSKKALEILKINTQIQKPLVEKHNGKWLKEMGDGVLVQFKTALDAVNCAIGIQEEARSKLDSQLRIGIHLGDITIRNDDVYGDGVNVASRLQSICDPGGVYISHSISQAIKGEGLQQIDLGERKLKNVEDPIRVFALEGVGLPVPAKRFRSFGFPKYGVIIAAVLLFAIIAFGWFYSRPSKIEISDKSIAVLPFDNLSNDPSQDYMSDGMMEAILNNLNKIEGLRLTSRTTMMTYKNSEKTVPQIAGEVGVRYVLEGSVLRADNTLRITAQLIDGQSDQHIWSDYYDGDIGQILQIQLEVAGAIAEKLEIQVSEEVRRQLEKVPTTNTEAYNLYLQAINLQFLDSTRRALLEKSVRLDPQFAEGYNQLGRYWTLRSIVNRSYAKLAEHYLNQSLFIDPDLASSHKYLSELNLWIKRDFLAAEREQLYAISKNPHDPFVVNPDLYLATGKFREALEASKRRIEAEPNNGHYLGNHAICQYFNGQYDEVLETYTKVVKVGELVELNKWHYYGESGRALFYIGEYERVVEWLETGYRKLPSFPRLIGFLASAHWRLGNGQRTEELILELKVLYGEEVNSPSTYLAMIYAQMGEINTAFEWLERAFEDDETEMFWLQVEPPFEPLHDDPRWSLMLEKIGFPPDPPG